MDQKAMVNLEIKKGERTFIFSMPIGAPFDEAFEAAVAVLNEVLEMSKRAIEQNKKAAEQAKAVEMAEPIEMNAEEFKESIEKANKE